jgi:hypothetical protein
MLRFDAQINTIIGTALAERLPTKTTNCRGRRSSKPAALMPAAGKHLNFSYFGAAVQVQSHLRSVVREMSIRVQ